MNLFRKMRNEYLKKIKFLTKREFNELGKGIPENAERGTTGQRNPIGSMAVPSSQVLGT